MSSADFYVGIGPDAEFLGSVEIDGQLDVAAREGLFARVGDQKYVEDTYRAAVRDFLASAIVDESGWAGEWGWEHSNSHGTDVAYCYSKGAVTVYTQGVDENGDAGLTMSSVHYPNGGRYLGKFPEFN